MTRPAAKTPSPGMGMGTHPVDRLTDRLYQYRGETAVPFAIALLVLARPTAERLLLGLPLIIAGEVLRLWAASHIGAHARGRRFRAPRRVTSGPYRLLRHPLYLGNALACAGLLIVAKAAEPWFALLVAVAFSIQYGLFIRREEAGFRHQPKEPPTAGQPEAPPPPRGYRPWLTREGIDLEWPTLRTIMALLLALLGLGWMRNS